jgi:hypothetical protein
MTETKEALKLPAIFSLRKLSDLSKVEYNQLYHAHKGTYNTLTDNDRTRLYNALFTEFEKASACLGFTADGRRIRPR